jgi:tetratricopeptide (TPR) repeat protein
MHNNGTFRSMVIVFIVFLASFDPYCAIADKKEKLDGYYIFSLIGSEKYDQASIEIEKSLQINPNCSFCYFARGYILDQKNNDKNAMQNYNKAIALSPNSPQYYFYRGKLKVSMAIFQAAGYSEEDKEKGLKSGIEDFTKGIQLKPENVHLYYRERGDAYLSISLFSKALMDFQNV